MLDNFRFKHPIIRLTGQPEIIRPELYDIEVALLAQRTLAPFWDPILDRTDRTETFVKAFELALEETIEDLFFRRASERLLLEIVGLIRIHNIIIDPKQSQGVNEDKRGVATTILGTMMQQRLSLFLAGIATHSSARAFGIGNMQGIDPVSWERHFVGAAAVAKFIRIIHRLNAGTLYLPTVHEDHQLGIDLMLLRGSRLLVISIKAGKSDAVTNLELVEGEPGADVSVYGNDRQVIRYGARKMQKRVPFSVYPVLVETEILRDRRFDVVPTHRDLSAVTQFLHTFDQLAPRHPPNMDDSAQDTA